MLVIFLWYWLPETALLPVQAPLARHEAALAADQLSVVEPRYLTVLGVAVKVSVGAGVVVGAATLTFTDFETLPPLPVQVKA